ncbi:MAG: hypothetical protein ABEJ03_03175 [Candidatus Nanohaloarchaea archaeon]
MTDDTDLVDNTIFELIIGELLIPWLYQPIDCLDSFIWENRHLFTLIGVFGAISVYLGTVEKQLESSIPTLRDIAIVTGLSLVTILSVLVLIKLWIEFRNSSIWEGSGLMLFAAFFVPLIMGITSLLTVFPQIWAGYFFMAIYCLGFATGGLSTLGMVSIGNKIDEFLGMEIPIFRGICILAVALFITITVADTNYLTPPIWSQLQPSGGISLDAWVNLYISLSLVFGGLFSYAAVAIFTIFSIIGGVGYLLLGLINLIQKLYSI